MNEGKENKGGRVGRAMSDKGKEKRGREEGEKGGTKRNKGEWKRGRGGRKGTEEGRR